MTPRTPARTALRSAFTAMAACAALTAAAEPLPPLPEADRPAWAAVGRINGAGIGKRTGCTGTLVAPDLVLTAAHCTGADQTIPAERHFVAGWDRGEFAAHRLSATVHVHPSWGFSRQNNKTAFDIAVIELAEPISPDLVTPLPVGPAQPDSWRDVALVGYHNQRPHVVNGRFDCPALDQPHLSVVLIECTVVGGNSGGPVLQRTADGWEVRAVVAARVGEGDRALAVPVDDWVMDQVAAAEKRASDRQ